MNVKKKHTRNTLAAAIPILLSSLLSPTSAVADTVLFPVIAVNVPNVTTVVSVINGPSGTSADRLRYVYKYKNSLNQAGGPNLTGFCYNNNPVTFDRNTANGDIVSFDASGTLNNGNALFGDSNSYGGSFDIGQSGPIRGYLLVSNCCTGGGAIVEDDGVIDLSGEAVIMDIASGAAWGMKAINDETSEGYAFVNVNDGGGVWSALPSNGSDTRQFSFFPLLDWTTRFFIAPLNSDMANTNADPGGRVTLLTNTSQDGEGVYDRQGDKLPMTAITLEINCTGAVDLAQLMDASTRAAVETGGGWAYFRVNAGNAIVYKLEYTLNSSTYGGTVNNSYLLSTYARP